ncbi:MAG: hypothetical protein CME43_15415 [Haliea sp.]|uniref:hypothetical protein n=1 Tax=Haliea sp. TaxID=1932666 RepID=UPI000C40D14E|nr:hypothetical protein [Haliea sp.]MBM70854.1 hypothetical protein [Haliea sp.]|tara:strand:+ start:9505 stop:10137 length:633 start_codon:yes stop_codon:yes gene_type:complete
MPGKYKIKIDESWSLEDLYVFSRTYEQVYFMLYSIHPDSGEDNSERIQQAYKAFPWKGGYSAVNFYNQLKYVVPPKKRPQINQIRYASPGFIELILLLYVARYLAKTVKRIASSVRECNSVYNQIVSDMQKRKLLRIDVKRKQLLLESEEMAAVEHHADIAARLLGFPNHQSITERTGNPYVTLKILLSLYRRVRTLAEFKNKGKADLKE